MSEFIGRKASLQKKFSAEEVRQFSELSLDTNPIHLDTKFAETTIFKKPIVHGFLAGSLISAVLANKLPGAGSIYLKQDMSFKKPVFFDDMITAEVEVIEQPKPGIFILKTTCTNQSGDVVIEGQATIMNKLFGVKA